MNYTLKKFQLKGDLFITAFFILGFLQNLKIWETLMARLMFLNLEKNDKNEELVCFMDRLTCL